MESNEALFGTPMEWPHLPDLSVSQDEQRRQELALRDVLRRLAGNPNCTIRVSCYLKPPTGAQAIAFAW